MHSLVLTLQGNMYVHLRALQCIAFTCAPRAGCSAILGTETSGGPPVLCVPETLDSGSQIEDLDASAYASESQHSPGFPSQVNAPR
jgi:hypothetical protein